MQMLLVEFSGCILSLKRSTLIIKLVLPSTPGILIQNVATLIAQISGLSNLFTLQNYCLPIKR